jgi:hypothetical protein
MAYLARLRNPETERYEHHGLSAVFGEELAEEALGRSHHELLVQWLTKPLAEQLGDVDQYLEGISQSRRKLLQSWERTQGYLNFLPPECSFGERVAYASSCEIIIKSLRSASVGGGALLDTASHPKP